MCIVRVFLHIAHVHCKLDREIYSHLNETLFNRFIGLHRDIFLTKHHYQQRIWKGITGMTYDGLFIKRRCDYWIQFLKRVTDDSFE